VNLVLLTEKELVDGLALEDSRTIHLLHTVGLKVGASFHVGIKNGRRGLAIITAIQPKLMFSVKFEDGVQKRFPLTVIVGLPRPQTAKKVLHDLASVGIHKIIFFDTEKGDAGYATSSLWKDGEWAEHVDKGAEQACSAQVPEVIRCATLTEALASIDAGNWKVALDPYEASQALGDGAPSATRAVLAIGPERGWSAAERALLLKNSFTLCHLGDHILRVESAALAGSMIVLSQLKVWEKHRPLAP
jgi:16S rRNA (uracil1498-N3)-methyltransferase